MLAALEIHPDESRLGYPLAWDTPLSDTPLLLRTVEAIADCPSVTRIAVLTPSGNQSFAKSVDQLLKRGQLPKRKKICVLPAPGRDRSEAHRTARLRRLAPDAW